MADRYEDDSSSAKSRGCSGTLTDGCVSGCVSCCFFYILLFVSFVLFLIGFLIFLGWIFGNLFTTAMPS